MKLSWIQKLLLLVAVCCFGGFLYCFLYSHQLAVLSFGTCMGVAFLLILALSPVGEALPGEASGEEDDEEDTGGTTHLDNLIDQLAERREESEALSENLEVAAHELEKLNVLLMSSERENDKLRSRVEALSDANAKLKDDLEATRHALRDTREAEGPGEESILPMAAEEQSEVLSICDVARKSASVFRKDAMKAGVKIQVVCPDESLQVKADPRMLDILFRNIIDNSVKYMGRAGLLQITISEVEDELFIVIKDNGEGLSAEETAHIFELNFQGTNRVSGNGLGLAQAKAIVAYYGGMIYARSRRNNGMGIYIHLPEAAAAGDVLLELDDEGGDSL